MMSMLQTQSTSLRFSTTRRMSGAPKQAAATLLSNNSQKFSYEKGKLPFFSFGGDFMNTKIKDIFANTDVENDFFLILAGVLVFIWMASIENVIMNRGFSC